jgi:hypothetical protein
MTKKSYWEGWGFNDTFKVILTGDNTDVANGLREIKQAFPSSDSEKINAKSFYVFVYDNELTLVKKIAKMFNLKVSYETGGVVNGENLIYVLYNVKDEADDILNSNGQRNRGWWKSNLNRKESDELLQNLKNKKLILDALIYKGDRSNIKFDQGGNVGEMIASSNPYIGGAKAIQGIAPESVSAIDRKMARKIYPDPNRPVFFENGGGVDIIAPFGTLVSKNKQQKLEYKKVGSNFEFMIYEGVNNPVSNYSRTSFKKSKNGSIIMNYNEFLKFIYSKGFVDDQKYTLGGRVPRKMELYDAVLYEGKQYDISIKNGVLGLKNVSQGAWGSDYPFIPLSKVDINDVTDMYGNKVEISEKYALGGKILASSSTKEGVSKLIEQYLYGSTITLVETEDDKIYEVHNKKGKTPFYVEFKRGKYNFIQPTKFVNGGTTGSTDYSVAQTILNQLGGMKRLVIMTGAYNFVASSNAVSFRIKNRKVNYIKITLNGNDLYDLKFSRIVKYNEKVVKEYSDIYFDQLIPIFEETTGMYLRMFKKGGFINTQNRDMVISQLKTIHHHEEEMLETLKRSGEVEAWVLSKVSNASSDLSDVAHYLEFNK